MATLLSMLAWRVVVAAGIAPSPAFTTVIAIWGAVGALLAMYFFSRDATRRAQVEAERDALFRSEHEARQDAELASATKDRFLATLSHELRTPLASILSWCAILRNSEQSKKGQQGIEVIERNARGQARLVEDLLDATRIQTGTLHLEHAAVPLVRPLEAAIEALRPQAESKEITLVFQPPQQSPQVLGDFVRLQQVVSNLLINAIKFSPAGARVWIDLGADAEGAMLSIRDEGIGIADEFMPRLFSPFQQADGTLTRHYGGLGLGLSIVSTLVRLHGGTVQATSPGVGKGSTFIVRLPARAVSSAPTHVPDASRVAADALCGVRVVVLDDEPDVLLAVATLLEERGATVLPLATAEGITDVVTSFAPSVLVLDISMPGEDGYSVLQRLRQTVKVPAISLTAHARLEDRDMALSRGFQAHLNKPVSEKTLIATIQSLTG
ncbi:MAG TPA: ATP-binding protein [Luteitalea sp.]|nr:ATP-binding protein [Luteitalea sp.]